MDCSFLINTAYVKGEYHNNHIHVNLETKSNDCIVAIKRKCNPCQPYHSCRPCDLSSSCNKGLSEKVCRNNAEVLLEIKLDRSYSIVNLPYLSHICEICPINCALNWYTLQGDKYFAIQYQYKLLYYDAIGQRKYYTGYIIQNDKKIDRKLNCDYRLRIDHYTCQSLGNDCFKIGIEAILEVWPKCQG